MLPSGRELLQQLYREAAYFGLEDMRRDIEKQAGNAALLTTSAATSADAGAAAAAARLRSVGDTGFGLTRPGGAEGGEWWRKPKGHAGYWPSRERGTTRDSWWTGSRYKGVDHRLPQYGDVGKKQYRCVACDETGLGWGGTRRWKERMMTLIAPDGIQIASNLVQTYRQGRGKERGSPAELDLWGLQLRRTAVL